ncbi:hypothetical protein V490_04225 [Pseudogymnoascus sp. VKM F-3557]|nr:hypothetical protein V490_04225 [Pseudogymnoascus sp. VKM F-3557]
MDPVSIVASACGIADLCGTIIVNISQFVIDSRNVCQSINDFRTNITILEAVLVKVQVTVGKGPKRLPLAQQELGHWKEISNVLDACRISMESLKRELPEPFENGRPTVNFRKELEMRIKSNTVVQIRGHITTYTQLLQLSLTTITLGSTWETQRSQNIMRYEIGKLRRDIHEINIVRQQPEPQRLGYENEARDVDNELSLRERQADKNFEAWRSSVEHLVDAVATLYDPDDQSIANRENWSFWSDSNFHGNNRTGMDDNGSSLIAPESELGGAAYQDSGLGGSDNGPDLVLDPESTDCLSPDIVHEMVAALQKSVNDCLNIGSYFQAERYQKEIIEERCLLEKSHNIPFSDRADVEEALADIYMQENSRASSLIHAEGILKQLLQQEIDKIQEPNDVNIRKWRLYHKLASVYIELGYFDAAEKYATQALNGRNNSGSTPNLIVESAALLAKVYKLKKNDSKAQGLMNWADKTYPQLVNTRGSISSLSTNDSLSNLVKVDVFQWCKDVGFDVNLHGFNFNTQNADKKTPLHIAVLENNLDIVKQIVDSVDVRLETRDSDQCTALLLACGTKNSNTTKVLLDHGAKVDVRDKNLNTPLHRVQDAKGGSRVARLLLDDSSKTIDINAKNCYDKTALHRACELGNDVMVSLLIDNKADIDCHGPHGCTPLHLAIDNRRVHIVKLLLVKNANISRCDDDERNAMKWAKTTKSPSPEIQNMLRDHEKMLAGQKRKQS